MDFELSEQQRIFVDGVERHAMRALAPAKVERAGTAGFPFDVARELAGLGLLGITLEPADGGMGGTLTDAVLAIQAVAAACPRSADVVQAGNFGAIRTFTEYASEAQKARFLPRLLDGSSIMAVAMSEPDAGSAVTELRTTATPVDGGYRIDGTKVWGTHSADAAVFLVYVRFGPGVDGIGSVLVERDAPGFTIGAPSAFMNGEHWTELHFDDCRIAEEDVLLGAGGFRRQIAGFNIERLGNAARSVAVGRHAFDVARAYALEREQFGRPIAEFQGLQWKLAEAATRLEAAQLLLLRAAARADKGLPDATDTAMAKLACNEAGFHAANEALQVMGAAGFDENSIVQYCVRRTRGWMIAGGSVEMLKNRIAEGLFERRFSQRRGG